MLRKYISKIIINSLLIHNAVVLFYVHPDHFDLSCGAVLVYKEPSRAKDFALISAIKKERATKLGYNEAFQLKRSALSVAKVEGDYAEVGAFNGGSTKIICESKGTKALHVFDTFEGLPDTDNNDSEWFEKGQYSCSLESVKAYLSEYNNVHYYKGLFPNTSAPVEDKRFAFVSLDVDLYSSTLDSLRFFYPRMSIGGIIMSHDYVSADGVRQAFDTFFQDKPEPIIELSGSQCLIVKTA